jgi:hypothetical protein
MVLLELPSELPAEIWNGIQRLYCPVIPERALDKIGQGSVPFMLEDQPTGRIGSLPRVPFAVALTEAVKEFQNNP